MKTIEELRVLHRSTFGELPDAPHTDLYKEFPHHRGFSEEGLDPLKFQAVFVICLHQLIVRNPGGERVLLLRSPLIKLWVEDELRNYLRGLLRRLTPDSRELYTQRLRLFDMSHQPQRLLEEPTRWASFGFAVKAPIPQWMKGKLL